MRRFTMASMVVVAAGIVWVQVLSGAAVAQPADAASTAASAAEPFVGTYRLVSIERRRGDGDWRPIDGERLGFIIYDRTGLMAVQIMPLGRQAYAAGQPTADEALQTLRAGYTAYYGPYTVNEGARTVTHHLEGHLNPGQVGSDATRTYAFSGNRLTLTPPSSTSDGETVTTRLTWERLPEQTGMGDVQKQFLGFWKLVSNERHTADGQLVSRTEGQTGYIIYTPTGHMAVHMMRAGRRKYAGAQPTAEEALATLTSYTSYFGPFTVDEAAGAVTHHRHGNLNPGQVDVDARRQYQFSGTRLILKPPPSMVEGREVQSTITWERVEGAARSHQPEANR